MGSLSLLQGIFPTQESNWGLLHHRWILYQLSHKGRPIILGWVAYPFSSRSSQPRNQTGVFCIAGGFFTNRAIREALELALKLLCVSHLSHEARFKDLAVKHLEIIYCNKDARLTDFPLSYLVSSPNVSFWQGKQSLILQTPVREELVLPFSTN